MKIYLVGGAVRDQHMGLPIKERDWVVVGATPNELKSKGFQQVGKDFPVFLHPKTREEYALARTEKKKGTGYYGFTCDFNPEVSLDEDLARRDLTINAMALDDKGKLIDPYHGLHDLKKQVLRHVSPAFVEDPVRVLRIARFAARYHHLGFTIANETRQLMYEMVKEGELNHLVPERVWQEWFKSLSEKNPDVFLTALRSCGALEVILPEINRLYGIPNPRRYHAEVDSGVHTIMVLQAAAESSSEELIRFAAAVHDLGKGITPMKIWPSHYGHEERGISIITKLCERLRIPAEFRKFAEMVSKHHINVHRVYELRAQTIVKILDQADAFRRPHLFEKMVMVCEADAKGKGSPQAVYPQREFWLSLLRECSKITAREVIEQGYHGEEIKKNLHLLRVNCVEHILKKNTLEKNEK